MSALVCGLDMHEDSTHATILDFARDVSAVDSAGGVILCSEPDTMCCRGHEMLVRTLRSWQL